jgi:hypothetical protein
MYKSITHFDSLIPSPLKGHSLPPLITTVETDVVASDIGNARSRMLPLLSCYQYLVACAKPGDPEIAQLTRELLMLFPEAVIPGSQALFPPNSPEFFAFCKSVGSILRTENSDGIAALCCDFLLALPLEFREGTFEVVEFMLKNPRVVSGASLFSLFRYYIELKPSETVAIREVIEKRLDLLNLALFRIKLAQFTPADFTEFQTQISFGQYPLSDRDFLDYIQKSPLTIPIADFDAIDDDHFKFFLQNQARFVAPSFEEYRLSHGWRMHRFHAHFEEPKVDLHFSCAGVSKRPSALPALLAGSTDIDDALAVSFLQHSRILIGASLFHRFVRGIKSPRVALAAIGYARRSGIQLPEDLLIEWVALGDGALKLAIAATLPRRADILDRLPADRDIFAPVLAPDAFLADFVRDFHPKSRNLLRFCQVLSRTSFDPAGVSRVVAGFLENVDSIESGKRLLATLRVLNQLLDTVSRKLPPEFINLVNEKLQAFQGTLMSSIYPELGSVLSRLFTLTTPTLLPICEAFDRMAIGSQLFVLAQTVALMMGCTPARFAKGGFVDLFKAAIPSQQLRLLIAIQNLVGCPQQAGLLQGCFNDLVRLFRTNLPLPVFSAVCGQLVGVLVGSEHFAWFQAPFLEKLVPLLFVDSTAPHFPALSTALSVISHVIHSPIPAYSTYLSSLLREKPTHPRISHIYRDYLQWLLQVEPDPTRVSFAVLEHLNHLEALFRESPSVDLARALVDALRVRCPDLDPALFLITKLAVLPVPLLPVLVLVSGYAKRCSPEELATCKATFDALSDIYAHEELASAVRLILGGKAIETIPIVEEALQSAS